LTVRLAAQAERGHLGDLRRQLAGGGVEFGAGDDAVDHADLLGLVGGQGAAGEFEVLRVPGRVRVEERREPGAEENDVGVEGQLHGPSSAVPPPGFRQATFGRILFSSDESKGLTRDKGTHDRGHKRLAVDAQ